jgi:hypothetical protein
MLLDEVVDVAEKPWLGYGAVVITVRKLLPDNSLRFAKPEELLHVCRSAKDVSLQATTKRMY